MVRNNKIYFVTRGSELIGASFDKEEMQEMLARENSDEFEAGKEIYGLDPEEDGEACGIINGFYNGFQAKLNCTSTEILDSNEMIYDNDGIEAFPSIEVLNLLDN